MAFPVPLPSELRDESVSLRALTDEDWRLEYELSRVPDVPAWTYYPADMDEDYARRRIARTKERHRERLAGRYAVLLDGSPVGTAGMAEVEGAEPELFYVLSPAVRGRGAATGSVRLLSQWLSSQGFSAVALETMAGNTASERVAERAGFQITGSHPGTHHGQAVQLNRWLRT
ncbi:GNAT family N-acetyltransferase [uncultured Arthrobacter sp.]|uniref:GNAT family N-acetyltransferase n=1 Tax=uncultured Arthrobacter sp. TaxID=114050 RepID=UPI0025F86C5C|nr:GNAT family N-acetyltransferase [uncultured Arthrobacter sp.]